jgi:membrane protease YdiL (CAAX protease family)
MPSVFDHALFVILALLFPIRAGLFGYRKLRNAAPEDVPRVRRRLYRGVVITQWSLLALALILWFGQGRELPALGIRLPFTWAVASGLVMALVAWFALSRQREQLARDAEGLARVRARLLHVERLLPRSVEERRWFDRVSVTAGVCEEVLYRGFMIWYFEHWMGWIAAVCAAAAVFGWSHIYQGVRGIFTTGLVGLLFGFLYVAMGSLIPVMALHAIVDIHSGRLGYAAFTAPSPMPAEPPAEPPQAPTEASAPGPSPV